jgi:hypothetical protein
MYLLLSSDSDFNLLGNLVSRAGFAARVFLCPSSALVSDIGPRVAAAVPQYVRVDWERHFRPLSDPADGMPWAHRAVPLRHKNVRGCALFALQVAETVDLVACIGWLFFPQLRRRQRDRETETFRENRAGFCSAFLKLGAYPRGGGLHDDIVLTNWDL